MVALLIVSKFYIFLFSVIAFSSIALVSASDAAEENCDHSHWGENDELGAANYITPERIVSAAKLVKKGISHPLGIVIEPGMPAFPPRYVSLQVSQPNLGNTAELYGWPSSAHDDVVQMWLGIGPQLDGLGHVGESDIFYNCNKGDEFGLITGLTKLGIENIPPIIGRGVLLNMARHFNVDTMIGGQPITVSDIKSAMRIQKISFKEGDIILFHTGWTDGMLSEKPDVWVSSEPGLTNNAARYIASFNPVAVGADTWGLGVVPPIEGDKVFYDHVIFIKEKGIYILETMNTGKLASENIGEFFFVLGQPRLKGAVQMIINPVAMW